MARFNPFNQVVVIRVPGEGKIFVPLAAIDEFTKYAVRICINYSSQIGASLILLVLLLLLTRPEKRNTPVFALNSLSLLINTIRSILQCMFFTGPFYNPYAVWTGNYSRVPSTQYGISIAGVVLTLLLVICLEASLVLQVQAVCTTMTRMKRLLVLVWSILIALVAIGFRFALTIENCIAIIHARSFLDFQWLAASSSYVTAASICCASLVFVTKLGIALKERRKLGLRQFGPMQIIFIMGCQTLFIPAILSVVQNFTTVPELTSQTLTFVAIFLPLSSIWASQSTSNPMISTSHLDKSLRGKILGALGHRSGGSGKKLGSKETNEIDTLGSDSPGTVEKLGNYDDDDLEQGEFRAYATPVIQASKGSEGFGKAEK